MNYTVDRVCPRWLKDYTLIDSIVRGRGHRLKWFFQNETKMMHKKK